MAQSWFRQHGVALMGFGGVALASLVGGVTAWNAVTVDVSVNTKNITENRTEMLVLAAEEGRRTDALELEIKKLGTKVDDVGTQVQVLQNEIENQKDGQQETQRDVREIRNLLQRYLGPPGLGR